MKLNCSVETCCFQQSFCCKPGGLPRAQAAGHLLCSGTDGISTSLCKSISTKLLARVRCPVPRCPGGLLAAGTGGRPRAGRGPEWLPRQTAAHGGCLTHAPSEARLGG